MGLTKRLPRNKHIYNSGGANLPLFSNRGESMIILITGASHTGKTLLAQKLMEKYKIPYLSEDLLKMGLIRSGNTGLTPEEDEALVPYLWNIVKEIIRTAVENDQHLIIEGCYIPFDWQKDFVAGYIEHIRYICLIMSEKYIRERFADIKKYASVIEKRMDDTFCTPETVLRENTAFLDGCKRYNVPYVLIDGSYRVDINL